MAGIKPILTKDGQASLEKKRRFHSKKSAL